MNTTQDDGGPAYPFQPQDRQGYPCAEHAPGLSIRDWFAGMALQGQLSCPETIVALSKGGFTAVEVAASCYEWADSMLAARKEAR